MNKIKNKKRSLQQYHKLYKAGLIKIEDIPKHMREKLHEYYGVDIRGTHNMK